MLKKLLLFAITTLGILGTTYAQERLLKKADEKYEEYSFSPAIDIYKKVYEKGFESPDLLKRLGNSYYYNAKYEDAAEVYKILIEKYDTVVSADYLFRYAQTLKTLGNYDASKEVIARFSEKVQNSGLERVLDLDYLSKIEENSGRYDIKEFPYNSKYSDFAPAYYKDGLIFSSDRDTGNLARYRHTWNAKDFLDLYITSGEDSTEVEVKKVQGDVNTRFHESTSILTKDGSTMFFTRNNFLDGKKYKDAKGTTRLKIYTATLSEEGEWENITELPFNSDDYSVAHPMLSPDEKVLYFVSDMPGSLGESDIFKVQIVGDGTYGSPVNLGKTINTEARETFPFITEEDVLYFSSDGHPGLGGLDVFATKIAFDEYDQPIVNVGRPINTKYDDFSFIIDANKKGYFSSNRPEGLGEDDIYAFTENDPISLECLQDITGTVRDRISNEILVGATVKIIDEQNQEVSSTITNDKGGYRLALDCNKGNFVRALMEGYVPSEEYLPKSYGKPQIVDFYLERDIVSGGFGDDLAKLLQLSTIYFDLNKYNIRSDAEIEIQKVIAAMEKYPSLKIKVNSHTDSQGNDAYNLWLSKKRAESTIAYMIKKGIAADRLDSEGFGEEKLLNRCGNGVRCSKEEHQLNRRSEFIILE